MGGRVTWDLKKHTLWNKLKSSAYNNLKLQMQEEITLFPMKQQDNWKKYELQFIAEYM